MVIFLSLVASVMMNFRPVITRECADIASPPFLKSRIRVSDQIPISHNQKHVVRTLGKQYKCSVGKAASCLPAFIGACRAGRSAVALLARTMIDGSNRRTTLRPKGGHGDQAGEQSSPLSRVPPKKTGRFGAALVLACTAFASVCIVISLGLLIQVRGLKSEIASSERELIATKNRLVDLDKTVRGFANARPEVASGGGELKILPAHIQIALNESEIQFIREFIKVAPPLPGAQPRLKVGDELPPLASLPIPDAVAERFPKLQGAKFAIDQNGAIVISGAGSSRVDVVIFGTPVSTQK
jgi:hypothetical protein